MLRVSPAGREKRDYGWPFDPQTTAIVAKLETVLVESSPNLEVSCDVSRSTRSCCSDVGNRKAMSEVEE